MKLHGFVFASNDDDWTHVEFFQTYEECVDKAYEKYKELWADNLDCYNEDGDYCFDDCIDDFDNKISSKREFTEDFERSNVVIQMSDYHVWCNYHIIELDI